MQLLCNVNHHQFSSVLSDMFGHASRSSVSMVSWVVFQARSDLRPRRLHMLSEPPRRHDEEEGGGSAVHPPDGDTEARLHSLPRFEIHAEKGSKLESRRPENTSFL